MIALEVLELVEERVELGIGDFRVLVNVVALFEMADLSTELFYPGCGIQRRRLGSINWNLEFSGLSPGCSRAAP